MAGRRSARVIAVVADRQAAAMPEILRRLALGESMNAICRLEGMPDRETVRRWCEGDAVLADRVLTAREDGFMDRAERAVENAKNATDAQLGRLAFDAERWWLGKLSNAFAERPAKVDNQTNIQVNLDGDSALGRLAQLMDGVAAGIAGGASSTRLVAGGGETGPDCPAG